VNVRGDFLHKFSGDIGISAVQRNTDERPPLTDRLTIALKAGMGSLPYMAPLVRDLSAATNSSRN